MLDRAVPRRIAAVLALAVAAALPSLALEGPGRIAIGGAFPHGYVGMLARHGLPRDVLTDDQVVSLEALKRYDIVIVAGYAGTAESILPVLRQYATGGGRVLLDYGPPPGLSIGPGPQQIGAAGGQLTVSAMSSSPLHLVGEGNPIDPHCLEGLEPARLFSDSYVPQLPDGAKAVLLAEFMATSNLGQGGGPGGPGGPRRPGGQRDTGPAAPAIWLESVGQGKILHSGQAIGTSAIFGGVGYDRLAIELLRVLSDGRTHSQVVPEGPQLHFGESVGAQRAAAGQADPQPDKAAPADDDAWPNGPGAAAALPAGFRAVAKSAERRFDLSGVRGTGSVTVLLGYWDADHTVNVVLNGERCRVVRHAGETKTLADVPLALAPGKSFTVKVRGETLRVIADGKIAVTHTPLLAGSIAVSGLEGQATYQPVEPVWFTDDFMRTDEHDGGWVVRGGQWSTVAEGKVEDAANPFSYKVDASAGPAMALYGSPWWDHYKLAAAVRPGGTGTVGLAANAVDADNLVEFVVKSQPEAPDAKASFSGPNLVDGFQLVRRVKGQRQLLRAAPGGLRAGQWYRLELTTADGRVTAAVDGKTVLEARDDTLTGGGIALLANGLAARFDDVAATEVDLPSQPGLTLAGQVPDGAGTIDVASWAGPATEWLPDTAHDARFWRRGRFYGDVSLSYALADVPDGGTIALTALAKGDDLDSGYTVALSRAVGGATVALRHGGQELSHQTAPLQAGSVLELRRTGYNLLALVDTKQLLTTPVAAGAGRVAFAAAGFAPKLSAVSLWTNNRSDETFEKAPTNWWVHSGTWELTNRWSCSPQWSWFGGYSDDTAAIWYKRELAGDVALDYYVGPKMASNDPSQAEIVGDFNLLLCGNGKSLWSGYAVQVAPTEGGVRLYRNGEQVAKNTTFELFHHSGLTFLDYIRSHNRWFNVRAEKLGADVVVSVEGSEVLRWTDPAPLTRGYSAVWTRANGIMVPRVSVTYERLGTGVLPQP